MVEVSSSISPAAGSLSASTQYYLYITTSGGSPVVEVSTTAPAGAYRGDAQTKTADTARRLIGEFLTDGSGAISSIFSWYEVKDKFRARALGAFSAYMSATQTVVAGTPTVIQFATELWNVNNWYNTGTFRYTPQIPGYYMFSWGCGVFSAAASDNVFSVLTKNGVDFIEGDGLFATAGSQTLRSRGSVIASANGTTDYFQVTGQTNKTSIQSGSARTFFQGTYWGAL